MRTCNQHKMLKTRRRQVLFLIQARSNAMLQGWVIRREGHKSGCVCCHPGTRFVTSYGLDPSAPFSPLPTSGRGGWVCIRTPWNQMQMLVTSHCQGSWLLKGTGNAGLASAIGCYSISLAFHGIWSLELLEVKFSFDVSKLFIDLSRALLKKITLKFKMPLTALPSSYWIMYYDKSGTT